MFPRVQLALISLTLGLSATAYAGDYTYQQTTQITGGSLLRMMKTVGVFSSQARHIGDPVVSTIYLKGNRLANVSADNIQIIDLDSETVTQIDLQKKSYYVTTFAQMKLAIENARAEAAQQQPSPQPAQPAPNPGAQNVKMSFDVKVRNTGVQKEISGLQSSESIMTMMLNATDTQSQQSGSMAITNDMWMVPAVPGYDQVRDFYKRFAAKMSDATVGLETLRLQQDARLRIPPRVRRWAIWLSRCRSSRASRLCRSCAWEPPRMASRCPPLPRRPCCS